MGRLRKATLIAISTDLESRESWHVVARTEDNMIKREETEEETDGSMTEYPRSEIERMYRCGIAEVVAVSYL